MIYPLIFLVFLLSACSAEWIDCGGKDRGPRSAGAESAKHIKECPTP